MIKAKKSLGQNFLIDQNIIDKIINTVEIKDKPILEIGPGTGNLTSKILEKTRRHTNLSKQPIEHMICLVLQSLKKGSRFT